jgi:hypothetical protein
MGERVFNFCAGVGMLLLIAFVPFGFQWRWNHEMVRVYDFAPITVWQAALYASPLLVLGLLCAAGCFLKAVKPR